jgi:hypothetical protein
VQLAPPRPSSTPPIPSSTLSSLLSGTSSFLFPSPSPLPPRSTSPQPRLYSTPHRPLITPRTTAHLITLPVQSNDILILASDGLSDNLWDEDVLDEVLRFKQACESTNAVGQETPLASREAEPGGLMMETSTSSSSSSTLSPSSTVPMPRLTPTIDAIRRHSLASMLSEALCSRARRISERRPSSGVHMDMRTNGMVEDEIPFARRAREAGKLFRGGKRDGALVCPSETCFHQLKFFVQIYQYWWQSSHLRLLQPQHSTLIKH